MIKSAFFLLIESFFASFSPKKFFKTGIPSFIACLAVLSVGSIPKQGIFFLKNFLINNHRLMQSLLHNF